MSLARATIAIPLAIVAVASVSGDARARQSPEQAAFLQRLSGEWSAVAEATLGPGQEPVRTESREVARMLGGRWLVAESTRSAGGRQLTSILTLGYDRVTERFVGTWIDALQAHMWHYSGTLNESGTALTLETEGPILGDPTRRAKYREVIEIHTPDHKTVRSMILGPDGEWFEFARADYRRRR